MTHCQRTAGHGGAFGSRARHGLVLVGCLLAAAGAPSSLMLGTGFGHVHVDGDTVLFHQHGNLGAHRHDELEPGQHPRPGDHGSETHGAGRHEPGSHPEVADHENGANVGDPHPDEEPGSDSEWRTIPMGAAPGIPPAVALDSLVGPPPPLLCPAPADRARCPQAQERAPGSPRGPPSTATTSLA